MLFRHAKICLAQLSLRSRGTHPECCVEVTTALGTATQHRCELPSLMPFLCCFGYQKNLSLVGISGIHVSMQCLMFLVSSCAQAVFLFIFGHDHIFLGLSGCTNRNEQLVGNIPWRQNTHLPALSETHTQNMMHSLRKDSNSSHGKNPWSPCCNLFVVVKPLATRLTNTFFFKLGLSQGSRLTIAKSGTKNWIISWVMTSFISYFFGNSGWNVGVKHPPETPPSAVEMLPDYDLGAWLHVPWPRMLPRFRMTPKAIETDASHEKEGNINASFKSWLQLHVFELLRYDTAESNLLLQTMAWIYMNFKKTVLKNSQSTWKIAGCWKLVTLSPTRCRHEGPLRMLTSNLVDQSQLVKPEGLFSSRNWQHEKGTPPCCMCCVTMHVTILKQRWKLSQTCFFAKLKHSWIWDNKALGTLKSSMRYKSEKWVCMCKQKKLMCMKSLVIWWNTTCVIWTPWLSIDYLSKAPAAKFLRKITPWKNGIEKFASRGVGPLKIWILMFSENLC